MNPSRTTGTPAAAQRAMTPTSAAISSPPTAARTSIGSAASGRLPFSAFLITATLLTRASSAMPVPRPVTRSTGSPVSTAVIAAAAVVLPIPISPTATTCAPAAMTSPATSMPASIAATASPDASPGPFAMSAVPGRDPGVDEARRRRSDVAAPGSARPLRRR